MSFRFTHNNINVFDLDKSLAFYKEMLGLQPARVKEADDKSFKLVFLTDSKGSDHQLELTWLRDREQPYNLGDNEVHLAFIADDFDKAYALHKQHGVICYENKAMNLYFISDPDGYWIEILPPRR